MRYRALTAFFACLCLLTGGGRASADFIIDENFDGAMQLQDGGAVFRLGGVGMGMGTGMWITHMSMGMFPAMWILNQQQMMGMGGFLESMPGMMGMMMGEWGKTVAYFVAKPRTGWSGDQLDLMFDYELFSPGGAGAWARFGVYGWPGPADVYLDSPTLGTVGMLLIGGMLPFGMNPVGQGLAGLDASGLLQQPTWLSAGGSSTGDLSGYEFLGLAFTVGGPDGSTAPDIGIDSVRLNLSPEPTTMALGAIGLAVAGLLRRRRRK